MPDQPYTPSSEAQRDAEANFRNEKRFCDANRRRRAAGLAEFSYTDYFWRRIGLVSEAHVKRIIREKNYSSVPPKNRPEHRDNVLILTRNDEE